VLPVCASSWLNTPIARRRRFHLSLLNAFRRTLFGIQRLCILLPPELTSQLFGTGSAMRLDTTNHYARANIETKRKALEKIAGASRLGQAPRWKRNADLMAWLDSM
jgi:hypothetical protein